MIGDLLREQERSPEPLDDVVIRTVCLVSQTRSLRHTLPHGDDLESVVLAVDGESNVGCELWPICTSPAVTPG